MSIINLRNRTCAFAHDAVTWQRTTSVAVSAQLNLHMSQLLSCTGLNHAEKLLGW